MSFASRPPTDKVTGLFYWQVVITIVLITLGFGGELMVVANYLQLSQQVETRLRPATVLLPQLSGLRGDVLRLHTDMEGILHADVRNFDPLDARRVSIEDRLAILRDTVPDRLSAEYQPAIAAVENLLVVYDSQSATLQNRFTTTPLSVIEFELDRAFVGAENALDDLYLAEEAEFFAASELTFNAIRNTQNLLLALSALLVLLGVGLVIATRRSAQREVSRVNQRLKVAAEVGRGASSLLSLNELFETTINLIRNRFGFYHASIFLIDDKGDYAVLRASTGDAGRSLLARGHKLMVGSNSVIGYVTANNTSRVVSDISKDPVHFRNELLPRTQSELAVPLRQGDQVIGALDVQSVERNVFSEEDIETFQILADQIAVAIGNAAEFTREQARAQQMSTLIEAAVELNDPNISLDQLIERIARRVSTLLHADDAAVWLDEADGALRLRFSVNNPSYIGQTLKSGEGLAGQVFASGRPLRLEDYRTWRGRAGAFADGPFHAALAVPILWQSQPIGVIVVTQSQPSVVFSDSDERVAQLFASQAAAAIENARLLHETQTRIAELYILNQISSSVTAANSADELLSLAVRHMVDLFGVDRANIMLLQDQHFRLMAEHPQQNEVGVPLALEAIPCGEQALNTKTPQVVNAIQTDSRLSDNQRAELGGAGVQSLMLMPILSQHQVTGFFRLDANRSPRTFTSDEVRLFQTVVAQVAIAIENRRLVEESHHRAEQLAALNRATVAAASELDLKKMLSAVSKEMVIAFRARNCGIALFDPTRTELIVTADYSADPGEPSAVGIAIPLENNPSSTRVIETGKSLLIANPKTDPLTEPIHELMVARNTECLAIVPLLSRNEIIGTIGIDSDERGRLFSQSEIALAENMARQIAGAIESIRLYQQSERRASQLIAAAEVSRAAASLVEPDELIVKAVEAIRDRFDLYYAALFLVDDSGQWAVLRYATGHAGRELLNRGHKLQVGGNSMVGTAVSRREARIALDVGAEPVRFANPLLPNTHSEMALPLAIGNFVVGALDVQSIQYNAFTNDDVTVLQTMADQITVALQNARLLQGTRQALDTANRLARRERLIAEVTNKISYGASVKQIMQIAAEELQRATGGKRAVVRLTPPEDADD